MEDFKAAAPKAVTDAGPDRFQGCFNLGGMVGIVINHGYIVNGTDDFKAPAHSLKMVKSFCTSRRVEAKLLSQGQGADSITDIVGPGYIQSDLGSPPGALMVKIKGGASAPQVYIRGIIVRPL